MQFDCYLQIPEQFASSFAWSHCWDLKSNGTAKTSSAGL